MVENFPEKKVLFVSAEKFMNEFIEATKTNKKRQFRKVYRDLDFLLLDDIHFIGGQEAVQDEFFHTFNALYKDGKQIVMTCDRPIREVPGIKERLVSRFEAGLITDMQPAVVETRLAILKKKLESRRMVVGDDVLMFIARRYTKNIRTLEGALNTLVAYSELMNVPPTLDTAKQTLKDEPSDEEPIVEAEASEPEPEIMPLERKTEKLRVAHSYLIEEERPVKCFEYFVDNLNVGLTGMAMTRMNPKRVKDGYDVVCGWRYNRKDPWSKLIAAQIANTVRKVITKEKIQDTIKLVQVWLHMDFATRKALQPPQNHSLFD